MFTVRINTENESFGSYPQDQLADILETIHTALYIQPTYTEKWMMKLMDNNGNTVGEAIYTP